ncbi:MAG: RNA-binding S4 domain-containing protein [Bacteroidales bacterium]|jgi:ribosome-associated protein|nr:RNA-binding S4 domain-containing protein [Bacteroidales bacterium]MDN5350302.1 ribosome-associated protein [Bacteroidales bacterium]
MIKFPLEGQDYILLNQLLKFTGLAESGGEANQMILAGQVKLNDTVALEKRRKIKAGDVVLCEGQEVRVF